VEAIVVGMENLDQQGTLSFDGLMAKVVAAVDADDCSGLSRPFLFLLIRRFASVLKLSFFVPSSP